VVARPTWAVDLLRAAQEVILQSAVGTAGTRRLDRGDSVARVRV